MEHALDVCDAGAAGGKFCVRDLARVAEKSMTYLAGRTFQIMGLIAMPSAIWVGHFGHDERGAIAIFLGSTLVFFIGFILTRTSSK